MRRPFLLRWLYPQAMRLRSFQFGIFACVALAAIFVVPAFLPVEPNLSFSSLFGFRNRAALLATLLAILIATLWVRDPAIATEENHDAPLPTSVLWQGLLATLLLSSFTLALCWPVGAIDEAPYLMTRLRLLMAGLHPYRDFEFLYGPALLYVPRTLANIFHHSAFAGYFATWFAMWLAGTTMMWWIVRTLRFPAARQRTAFWLVWLIFLPLNLNAGLTYTPLRQLSVLFCVLLFQRLWDRGAGAASLLGAAVLMQALLFTLSPEMPIALTAAVFAYALVNSLRGNAAEKRASALSVAFATLLSLVLLFIAVTRLHWLDSAKEFGSGGADIPPLLAPVSLILLGATMIAAIYCVARLRDRHPYGAAAAAAVAAFPLLPASFGRSDPPHFALYLMGALLVAMLIASRSTRAWRVAVVCCLFVCAHLTASKLVLNWRMFYQSAVSDALPEGHDTTLGLMLKRAARKHGGEKAVDALMLRTRTGSQDTAAVFPYATPQIQAPFGYYLRGNNSVLAPRIELGYFDGMNDIMGAKQIERKIREMDAHPERNLALPTGFSAANCEVSMQGADHLQRALWGYNYLRARNAPVMLRPLCQHILQHYQFKSAAADPVSLYELWSRR